MRCLFSCCVGVVGIVPKSSCVVVVVCDKKGCDMLKKKMISFCVSQPEKYTKKVGVDAMNILCTVSTKKEVNKMCKMNVPLVHTSFITIVVSRWNNAGFGDGRCLNNNEKTKLKCSQKMCTLV